MYERRIPFSMRVLNKLSQEGLFTYQLEPVTGDFAYLSFKDGMRHYVTRSDIRVNFVGPHEIAKNKYVTDQFLQQVGYPVVPSKIFFGEKLREQYSVEGKDISDTLGYAKELGYPLIVKPNNGFHGDGIFKVSNETELIHATNIIFQDNNRLLVQEYFKGEDYRLVVYRGKFQFAYRRTPLAMVGNGTDSILDYLEKVEKQARETGKNVDVDKDSVLLVIARLGYTLESIPAVGESVQLLDNANLSTGGSATDVSTIIHPEFIRTVEEITVSLNLNLSGIDMLIDGDITKHPSESRWVILEVNGSPGFEGFATIGEEQEQRVVRMFREIVQDISEGHYATYLPKN